MTIIRKIMFKVMASRAFTGTDDFGHPLYQGEEPNLLTHLSLPRRGEDIRIRSISSQFVVEGIPFHRETPRLCIRPAISSLLMAGRLRARLVADTLLHDSSVQIVYAEGKGNWRRCFSEASPE